MEKMLVEVEYDGEDYAIWLACEKVDEYSTDDDLLMLIEKQKFIDEYLKYAIKNNKSKVLKD